MVRYITRRILTGLGLLLVLSAVIFSLQDLAPGSVVDTVVAGTEKTPGLVERVEHAYGLDRPLPERYYLWLQNAVQLDLGRSYRTGEPVSDALERSLPVSVQLAVYGFLIAIVAGVGLGVLSGLRRQTLVDRAAGAVAVFGGAVPAFVLGTYFIFIFTVKLDWFPSFGIGEGIGDRLWHLTLPAMTLGLTGFALILKLTRAGLSEALDQDYYGFARARGVRGWKLIRTYGLRTGLIPLVTGASTVFTYMLTAAVLVEVTFSVPGVASLLVNSVRYRDVPMIQGITLLIGAVVILVNLLVDISYRFIDPRVRREMEQDA